MHLEKVARATICQNSCEILCAAVEVLLNPLALTDSPTGSGWGCQVVPVAES